MSAPFTFNFSLDTNKNDSQEGILTVSQQQSTEPVAPSDVDSATFSWIPGIERKFQDMLEQLMRKSLPHDLVRLSQNGPDSYLKRIREGSLDCEYQNTDIVCGVYEGGLKVWECSVDLCRYLQTNHDTLEGSVLELGCGHGLPGCWALNRTRLHPNARTTVVFSDFNEFVLRDATVANIALNAVKDGEESNDLPSWLSKHCALAAGDWHIMSHQMLDASAKKPEAVPGNGLFDYILAAETTYSAKAAEDTAQLIAKHLKPGTGVALVATKRYYFGVGGGSASFRDALKVQPHSNGFEVEAVEVYDDGASNIRELLKVRKLSP